MDDNATKFGCGRYIQEPCAVAFLGREVASLKGSKALIIGGKRALDSLSGKHEKSLQDAGIDYDTYVMTTDCSYEELDEITMNIAPAQKTDIVIGVGGGKVMDMAKAVAKRLGQCIVNLPTSVATFCCWSPMSVMYYPDGRPKNRIWHESEVDCVIVDTQILANSPVKLFASGMADVLAKNIETNLFSPANTVDTLPAAVYATKLVSQATNEIIFSKGEKAYRDIQSGIVTDAVDDCVFANVATNSIAAVLSHSNKNNKRVDRVVSFAHALYYAIRNIYTQEAKGFLHGEIVGLGLRAQMTVYDRSEYDVKNFCRFLDSIGQPKSIAELGISPTDANIKRLADECMVVWSKHPEEDRAIIHEALHLIEK